MEADGRKEKEIEKEKALNKRVCVCVYVRVVSIFKLYCDVYYILLPQMELSLAHIASFIHWQSLQRQVVASKRRRRKKTTTNTAFLYIFLLYVYRDYNVVQFGNKYKKR